MGGMKRRLWLIGLLVFGMCVCSDVTSFAQGSSSNYRIDESFVGPGGELESNSTNFKTEPGSQSVGNTAAGGEAGNESVSTSYSTQGGHSTTNDPSLSCSLNTSSLNFESLSTSTAATATATFSVLNYTAYGYIVQAIGSPPVNGAHTLAGMSSTAPSSAGTEQFGINLVANTAPATFGANPSQNPSSVFSFGAAAANYNTANNFRYVAGETIASAPRSSGLTDYTISYIINVANTTPGGSYTGSQSIVCIGTY